MTAAIICSSGWPDYRIAQQARVARTFQNIRLFPGMTALENLLIAQHNALMSRPADRLGRSARCRCRAAAESAAIDQARSGSTASA